MNLSSIVGFTQFPDQLFACKIVNPLWSAPKSLWIIEEHARQLSKQNWQLEDDAAKCESPPKSTKWVLHLWHGQYLVSLIPLVLWYECTTSMLYVALLSSHFSHSPQPVVAVCEVWMSSREEWMKTKNPHTNKSTHFKATMRQAFGVYGWLWNGHCHKNIGNCPRQFLHGC